MKLVKLNTALITAGLQQHEQTGTPVPFNTSFHPASDAPDLTRPSETPYSFKHWLSLILRTRQQTTPSTRLSSPAPPPSPPPTTKPTSATTTTEAAAATPQSTNPTCPPLQTIRLTRRQTKLLLAATEASLPLRQVNRLFREDLAEDIAPLLHSTLVFPPGGLFLRLDECSPKDGAGPMVLRSVQDVLLRLVTSVRARNALVHFLEGERRAEGGGGEDGDAQGVELFFLPFDGRMASEREYRVFCRPGDGRVCGISQYRWYRAWRFQGLEEAEQDRVVRRVVEGAGLVRGLMLEEVAKRGTEEDKLLLEQGFSFDLFYDEETDGCSLVELNTFGVRSACGSCLFQWVEDRRVLYGEEEAQFRVSVDMQGRDGEERPEPIVRVSRLEDTERSSKSSDFGGQDWRGFLGAF